MKKNLFYAILGGVMALGLSSCNDDDEPVTVDYAVTVYHPEFYKDQLAEGVSVVLENTFTGEEKSGMTDASGRVDFTGVLPGSYQITATKELAATEAQDQTGIESEVFLNAVQNNLTINIAGESELTLTGGAIGGWVLKEIYWTGAAGGGYYSNDQFYEIFNNSSATLYADSLMIGDVVGNPYVSSNSSPSGFLSDTENVYFQNIFMISGNGTTYPVEPGESILIARSAVNHHSDSELGNPNSAVDLGAGVADFEVYWEQAGRDTDNPDVTNMEIVHYGVPTMFDWFATVFGPSIAIFKHDDPMNLPQLVQPNTTSIRTYPQVPVENVLDAVDATRNSSVSQFKRLPVSLDAGFVYATNSYTGESVRRKVKTEINGRKVLQDSNNSSEDFELLTTPTPKAW